MGKVSCIAQVEAVGYGSVGLNVRVADLYPRGGMQSAPVKKARIVLREILLSSSVYIMRVEVYGNHN